MHDKKLFMWAGLILVLPLSLAFFGHDQFRYPCQDPANWDKPECKLPICDVTRTCPEQIFKGQRDPRLGPPAVETQTQIPKTSSGVYCGPK